MCWDEKLVSQVQDVEAGARKTGGPRLDQHCMMPMSETTNVQRAKYRVYYQRQRRWARQLQDLLHILNDANGMGHNMSRMVATEVYMMVSLV